MISSGPFTLRPSDDHPDTLTLVFGIVVGENLISMRERAARARSIYLSGGQVSVDGPSQEIPLRSELLQNYPNPFNPSTTIRYTLPHSSFVTLTVYNTLGQQAAQLVNEQQGAGDHETVFRGDGLASGVYFYRLEAGSFTSVKKLLLLR